MLQALSNSIRHWGRRLTSHFKSAPILIHDQHNPWVAQQECAQPQSLNEVSVTELPPLHTLVFNGPKPLVVVNSARENQISRGDVQGAIGLGRRIATMIKGDFIYINNARLDELFPAANDLRKTRFRSHREQKLAALFEQVGHPDFYFCSNDPDFPDSKDSGGIWIRKLNENLPSVLGRERGVRWLSPHHITQDVLKCQGYIFASDYAELPRPLIGWFGTASLLCRRGKDGRSIVTSLLRSINEGTLFLCTGRRTDHGLVNQIVDDISMQKPGLNVVVFNYNNHYNNYGPDNFYNPYIGLLDQADHIIISGPDSYSTVSEALATDKTVHVIYGYDEDTEDYNADGKLRWIKDTDRRSKLQTQRHAPLDLSNEIAREIIRRHSQSTSSITDTGQPRPRRRDYEVI